MSTVLNQLTLRSGTPADLPAVSEVMADAFDPRFGEAWTSAQCLGMLSLPGVWLTLADREGGIAGFALAREVAGDAELLLLAVRPGWRGQGIGAALLRSVIDEARERGATTLHLEVRAQNSAVALYRAHRFEQVGERRNYYRGRDGYQYDAHSFARKLA
jgi:[ribosomal protein S18]-alanine N-acetyltransferase